LNQPRFPLRVNAGFLLNQPIGTYREIRFEYPLLHMEDDVDFTDLSGMARITRTPQGMLVDAEFKANTGAECGRCLTDLMQHTETTFSELFAFDERSASESGLILPEDANIDLEPLVREYLLIEVPINPICRADCKGLCPECGVDLNRVVCEHVQPGTRSADPLS
jgi:uncharacterized protein